MFLCATQLQPPPQGRRFSHGRGEREMRVTSDKPQETMGRVPLSPSCLLLRAHRKRDVWVRGRHSYLYETKHFLPQLLTCFLKVTVHER